MYNYCTCLDRYLFITQIYKKREYCFFLHHALAVWKCEISLLLGKKPHRIGDWNLGLGRPWHYTVTIWMQVYKSFTTFLQFQTKTGAMHECLIPGTFCLLFFISTIIFFLVQKVVILRFCLDIASWQVSGLYIMQFLTQLEVKFHIFRRLKSSEETVNKRLSLISYYNTWTNRKIPVVHSLRASK